MSNFNISTILKNSLDIEKSYDRNRNQDKPGRISRNEDIDVWFERPVSLFDENEKLIRRKNLLPGRFMTNLYTADTFFLDKLFTHYNSIKAMRSPLFIKTDYNKIQYNIENILLPIVDAGVTLYTDDIPNEIFENQEKEWRKSFGRFQDILLSMGDIFSTISKYINIRNEYYMIMDKIFQGRSVLESLQSRPNTNYNKHWVIKDMLFKLNEDMRATQKLVDKYKREFESKYKLTLDQRRELIKLLSNYYVNLFINDSRAEQPKDRFLVLPYSTSNRYTRVAKYLKVLEPIYQQLQWYLLEYELDRDVTEYLNYILDVFGDSHKNYEKWDGNVLLQNLALFIQRNIKNSSVLSEIFKKK